MSAASGPAGTSSELAESVRTYIESYKPTTLNDEQWGRLSADVRALTSRSEPVSTTDVKTFMSTLCAFLAWSEQKYGQQPVAGALSADPVSRHIADLDPVMSAGGRSNARGRLHRALRVLAGEPARTKRQPRTASAPPLRDQELDALVPVARDNVALAAVLQLVQPRESSCDALDVPAPYTPPCDDEWAQARQAAATVGVSLTLDRVRVSWSVRQLSTELALSSLLPATKATRADLENAKDYLPEVDHERYRAHLRG
jgi:hypothetical protein